MTHVFLTPGFQSGGIGVIGIARPRIQHKVNQAMVLGANFIVVATPPHADSAASRAVEIADLVLGHRGCCQLAYRRQDNAAAADQRGGAGSAAVPFSNATMALNAGVMLDRRHAAASCT